MPVSSQSRVREWRTRNFFLEEPMRDRQNRPPANNRFPEQTALPPLAGDAGFLAAGWRLTARAWPQPRDRPQSLLPATHGSAEPNPGSTFARYSSSTY